MTCHSLPRTNVYILASSVAACDAELDETLTSKRASHSMHALPLVMFAGRGHPLLLAGAAGDLAVDASPR